MTALRNGSHPSNVGGRAEHPKLDRPVRCETDQFPVVARVANESVLYRHLVEMLPTWKLRRHGIRRDKLIRLHPRTVRAISQTDETGSMRNDAIVRVQSRFVIRQADVDVQADDLAGCRQNFWRHSRRDIEVPRIRENIEGHTLEDNLLVRPPEVVPGLELCEVVILLLKLLWYFREIDGTNTVLELTGRHLVGEVGIIDMTEHFRFHQRDLAPPHLALSTVLTASREA